MRFPILAFALALPLFSQSAPTYSIQYTGRTLGYYRIPGAQTDQQKDGAVCGVNAIDLQQVRVFREQLSKTGGPRVLVGMGDNFSPEFGARMMMVGGQPKPKSLMLFDFAGNKGWIDYQAAGDSLNDALARGQGVIPFDNVACFFKVAGFDALVPGKHDFEFGPEKLREIARYLRQPGNNGEDYVNMMAANLTIGSKVVNPPDDTPDPLAPVNYALRGPGGARMRLPAIALPYIREFQIEKGVVITVPLTPGSYAKVHRLEASDIGDQSPVYTALYSFGWLCGGSRPVTFDPKGCTKLYGLAAKDRPPNLVFRLPEKENALTAGSSYYVCASKNDAPGPFSKDDTLCSATFQPHHPFFQYGAATVPNPDAYRVVNRGGVNIAIFGVVDSDLREHVGQMNDEWLNVNQNYDTQVEVGDPHEALNQVLQTCNVDTECKNARRILLAQMPAARAERLALHLSAKFDAVIAQTDGDFATADFDVTQPRREQGPLVLVPAPHYSGRHPNSLNVTLQSATLTQMPSQRILHNEFHRRAVVLPPASYGGSDTLYTFLVNAQLAPPAPASGFDAVQAREVIANAVLTAMRGHCKADIAFLQRRDLFRPDDFLSKRPANAELQSLLDRLLWKGDLILCRPVTGAVIKKVLARSDELDSADQDELGEESEPGRGLIHMGVFKDSNSKEYVVNGTPIQDKTLYTVAGTDFLALGDTGYPALRDTPVPPAFRLSTFKKLDDLSALFCARLIGDSSLCRPPIDAAKYFDGSTLAPYSQSRGLNAHEKLAKWASDNWAHRDLFAAIKGNTLEYAAQNRRAWSLRLDKADLGFQQNLHSLSESDQKTNFTGVHVPQATAPEKVDSTLDWLLRWTSFGKMVDFFAQSDADYQVSAVRTIPQDRTLTSNEPYQVSQSKNTLAFESGITTRLIPRGHKNPSGLKVLTSARYETELVSPFVQFSLKDGPLNKTIPRKKSVFGKFGLRYDGDQSWAEAGFQSGQFSQIATLAFKGLAKECAPNDLPSCVTGNDGLFPVKTVDAMPLTVTSNFRAQSGFFFNARVHMPLLYKKVDYVIENKGIFYLARKGDTSADTRYLDVITHSLAFKLFGNLSIVPKVDIFFFENKSSADKAGGFHIHGYQTSISAQYRFDWHTGLRFRSALKYANPAPDDGK